MSPEQWARLVLATMSVATVVVAVSIAVRARMRVVPTRACPLVLTSGSIVVWTIASVIGSLIGTEQAQTTALLVALPATGVLAAAVLWHALVLAGRVWRLGLWAAMLLALEPVLLMGAVVLPGGRELLFSISSIGTSGELFVDIGPLSWAHIAYFYLVVGVGWGFLVSSWRYSANGARRILLLAQLSLLPPVATSIVTVAEILPIGFVDLVPPTLLFTAVVWWRLGGQRELFDLPVTSAQVLGALGDGVLVVAEDDRVVRINRAAHDLLSGAGCPDPTGRYWTELLDGRLSELGGAIELPDGTFVDVRVTRLASRRNPATVVVMRDVTDLEQLRVELADQAVRDGLTGLLNRRAVEARLAETAAGRTCVAMIDLDHFKLINDIHGHTVGDEVLVEMAHRLESTVREQDVVGRWGGEEFLVLLPGAKLEELRDRIEQWRISCTTEPIETSQGPVQVSMSVGLAEGRPGDDVDALVSVADRALYAAKAGGRGQTVVAEPTR